MLCHAYYFVIHYSRFILLGPDLQNVLRLSYDNAKVTIHL